MNQNEGARSTADLLFADHLQTFKTSPLDYMSGLQVDEYNFFPCAHIHLNTSPFSLQRRAPNSLSLSIVVLSLRRASISTAGADAVKVAIVAESEYE